MGRNTAGVRIISLKEDDTLVSTTIVDSSDLELVDEGEAQRIEVDPTEEAEALADGEPDEPENDESFDEGDEGDEE
jgi:DNA gyrase/topoisomerase IV subunit A